VRVVAWRHGTQGYAIKASVLANAIALRAVGVRYRSKFRRRRARRSAAEIDPNRPSEPNLFDHVVSDGKELRRQFDTERQP